LQIKSKKKRKFFFCVIWRQTPSDDVRWRVRWRQMTSHDVTWRQKDNLISSAVQGFSALRLFVLRFTNYSCSIRSLGFDRLIIKMINYPINQTPKCLCYLRLKKNIDLLFHPLAKYPHNNKLDQMVPINFDHSNTMCIEIWHMTMTSLSREKFEM